MKSVSYFDWVNHFFIGVMTLLAFVVWGVFAVLYPQSDTVTIFSLDRTVPKTKDIMTGSGASILDQRYKAEVVLLDFCVMPRLYEKLKSLENPLQFIQTNQPTGSGRVDIWANTHFESWYKHIAPGTSVVLNDYNLPYDKPGNLYTNTPGSPNLPPQHFLPLCRCFHAVLSKFEKFPDSSLSTELPRAISAMNSCLHTRQMIPRQNFETGSLASNDISNTKSMSRSGFLLMMALVLVLNLVYRRWNVDAHIDNTLTGHLFNQKAKKFAVFLLLIFIFLLPAVYIVLHAA